MNKSRKSLLTLVLAMTMLCSLFAGCAGTPKESPSPENEAKAVSLDALLAGTDKDYAFSIIEELSLIGNTDSELGFRNAGSTGEAMTADRIVEELKALGFETINDDTIGVDGWEFKSATLTVEGEAPMALASLAGTSGTPEGGITSELVDVSDGKLASYEGKDVTGKIVLASFDNNAYWFSSPIYEAELAGAAAMIICVDSESYSTRDETMISFDCAARAEIPVVTISKENIAALRGKLESGSITVTLDSDITLSVGGGTSRVISAVLPGRNPEQNISLGAHYDGFFHSFQDDLYGCGVLMGLAKSMIETGYQPEHNIVFNFIPAEEYGASDSHYDWCTGVWKLLTELHPEWSGKTLCHLEVDSVRPDADTFVLNSTPEMHDYFTSYVEGLTPPADPYVNGTKLAGLNGPWSQDYSFSISGIPGLCAGKAGSEWKTFAYHTQLDDASAWVPEVYEYIYEQYMTMLYGIDQLAVAPLNFTAVVDGLRDTLDDTLISQDALTEINSAADEVYPIYQASYEAVVNCNALFAQLNAAELAGEIKDIDALAAAKTALAKEGEKLLAAYKVMQGELMRLDIWDMVTFPHEQLQLNLSSLKATAAALEGGDGAAALEALINVDTTYLAADFSKTVYEYVGIKSLDPTRDDLYWGTGQTMPQLNTYDVYHAIAGKAQTQGASFGDELAIISGMIEEEQKMLNSAIADEARLLKKAGEIVSGADLAAAIVQCEALLNTKK